MSTASILASPSENFPTTTSVLRSEYLTEEEFAHVVRRDVRTTRRWHAMRVGPPRISFNNKLVLYRRESVVEWLNSLEHGKPSRRKSAARR